jgi:hypothetical protein
MESISSPPSTGKVIDEIHSRIKHDCLRRIPTIAGDEKTVHALLTPIKTTNQAVVEP